MDNYSKNKINILGFIALIIWGIIVIAVANHNSPFIKSDNQATELFNGEINIFNNFIPLPPEDIKTEKTQRWSFESQPNFITTKDSTVFPIEQYGDILYKHDQKELKIYSDQLELLKTYSFQSKITGALFLNSTKLFIITADNFLYGIDLKKTKENLERITKLSYEVIKTINFEKVKLLLTRSNQLINLSPINFTTLWKIDLKSTPHFIHKSSNKILIFYPDNTLEAYDATDSNKLFEINYPYTVSSIENLSNNSFAILNEDQTLVRLDADEQKLRWEIKTENVSNFKLLPEHNILFTLENSSRLNAINLEDGSELWNRNLEHQGLNFIFPIKVTAKEIQAFELGWRNKGEVFVTACSNTGLCFIDPKNGRVLKINRKFDNYNIEKFGHSPIWKGEQLTFLAIGSSTQDEI